MSLENCIINGKKEGLITEEQAKEATAIYRELAADLFVQMGGDSKAAEAAAAKATFDQLKANVAHRRRIALLTADRWKMLKNDIANYTDASGRIRPGRALKALVERDHQSNFMDLTYKQDSIRAMALGRMADVLAKHRRGMFGQTLNKAELPDIVRAVFGEESTQAAKEIAEGWTEAANYLRLRANMSGMRIPYKKGWGLPQVHNAFKIREYGKKEWKAFIRPLLDPGKMIDEKTGLPFNDATLEMALDNTYRNIIHEGTPGEITPGSISGKALHNRHTDHRFLIFENADSWMKYQNAFGEPDTFHTMVGHVDHMAKEIAQLEILGPNPQAMVAALKQQGKKMADILHEGGDKDAIRLWHEDAVKFERFYNYWHRPNQIGNVRIAAAGQGTRDILGAALLGTAPLAAIADINTLSITTAMSGVPKGRLFGRVIGNLLTLNQTERFAASTRMGIIAEHWTQTAYSQARLFGETSGHTATSRFSDSAHKFSGLNRWTHSLREAHSHEWLGFLADNVGKKYGELEEGLQKYFKRYNISASEWEFIRKTPLHDVKGSKFLNPIDIEKREDLVSGLGIRLADKVMAMVKREVDLGTPTASLQSQVLWKAGTAKGTLQGELLSSASMFKSFPVTIVGNNLGRYLLDGMMGAKYKRAAWAMTFVVGSMAMGALVIQAKTVIRGRDPEPMNTVDFWVRALLQGGGLGIFGDFLVADHNRFGGGFGKTVSGPLVQFGSDAWELTKGNISELAAGEETNFGHELTDFVGRYTPGSSIWYLRAAYERALLDQIRKLVDPKAEKRFRRKMKYHQRNYNAGHWWPQGQAVPERAPDFTNVMGQ